MQNLLQTAVDKVNRFNFFEIFRLLLDFRLFLSVLADSPCPKDHYQCRNPEQCVAFENLCTVDWNFGTITQEASHRCYDQLYCKQGVCRRIFIWIISLVSLWVKLYHFLKCKIVTSFDNNDCFQIDAEMQRVWVWQPVCSIGISLQRHQRMLWWQWWRLLW